MLRGLGEIDGESMFFMKVKPFVTGMGIYSGILYFLDLVGASMSLGLMTYVFAIISTTVSLYISYNIVMGVIDMEGKYSTNLNGANLKSTWMFLAVINILTFLSLMLQGVREKNYSYVCELAREITQQMLESYDKELAEKRDKKLYRGKGKRSTTIKTVYGEVEYARNVYRTVNED